MPVKNQLLIVAFSFMGLFVRGQNYQICDSIYTIPATPPSSGNNSDVLKNSTVLGAYGSNGTLLYSAFNVDGSGTYVQIPTSNTFWIDNGNSVDGGPFNRCAVWDIDNSDSIGFSHCINVPSDSDYYMGFAADNYATLIIDGNTIIQEYAEDNGPYYTYWSIYKIHLAKGKHFVEILGYNYGGNTGPANPAAIGFEIYNNTATQIMNATSYNDLNVIFSTMSQFGQPVQVGNPALTYTCPNGYSLDFCSSNIPVCSKIVADTISLIITNPVPVCAPGTIDITSASITQKSRGSLNYTYWLDTLATKPLLNPREIAVSGTYFIEGNTNDDCSEIRPVAVTINNKPNPGNDTTIGICQGSSANLLSIYKTNGYATATWIPPSPTNAGAGIDSLIVTNAEGCGDTLVVTIMTDPKPNLGNDTSVDACEGTMVNLNNLYNISGYKSVVWNNPAPTTAGPGSYTLIVTNNFGCSDTAIANITQLPAAHATIDTAICYGQTYDGYSKSGSYFDTLQNLAANGCDSIITLHLTVYPEAVTTIDTAICYPASFEGYNTTGTYTKMYKTFLTNCDSVVTINLTVNTLPKPVLVADTVICVGQSIMLNPGNFVSYLWQDGSAQNSYTVTDPGTYSVTVTNTCGSATGSINVASVTCDITFPTVFTPNGDGRNDVFKALDAYGLSSYHLAVYNRWGQKVFATNNVSQGWDGTTNGQQQQTGTFVWFCEYTKPGDTHKTILKGIIVLVR